MLYIGSDHAGFALKEKIKDFLEKKDYKLSDLGAYTYDEHDDYPDFILPVARAVAHDLINGKESYGIVLGYSGQGEAMAANRVDGVRAAVFYGGSKEIVTLSREHNNANILSLGVHFLSDSEAFNVLILWLDTKFSGDERHMRRIMKF